MADEAFDQSIGAIIADPVEEVAFGRGLGFGAVGFDLEHMPDSRRHVEP